MPKYFTIMLNYALVGELFRAVGTGPADPATAGPMFGLIEVIDLKVIQKVSTPFKKLSSAQRTCCCK